MNESCSPLLIGYALGDLAADDAAAVERTVARDPDAKAWLAKVRVVLGTLGALDADGPSRTALDRAIGGFARPVPAPASGGWIETACRLVADLVFDSRAQQALAGFRGGSAGAYQLGFEGDDVRVDVQVSRAPEQGRWRVRGSVHTAGRGRTATEAALVHAPGAGIAPRQPIDDRGRFLIDIDPGTYDLVIQFENEALVAPALELP
jgi:anti-sigma factor RsiW